MASGGEDDIVSQLPAKPAASVRLGYDAASARDWCVRCAAWGGCMLLPCILQMPVCMHWVMGVGILVASDVPWPALLLLSAACCVVTLVAPLNPGAPERATAPSPCRRWKNFVFGKTFVERRSLWTMYRCAWVVGN